MKLRNEPFIIGQIGLMSKLVAIVCGRNVRLPPQCQSHVLSKQKTMANDNEKKKMGH